MHQDDSTPLRQPASIPVIDANTVPSEDNSADLHGSHSDLDAAIARSIRKLAPFLMLMYIVSFLDRANIGFAKQALEASEGISEHVYALAAGLFSVTELMSNPPLVAPK